MAPSQRTAKTASAVDLSSASATRTVKITFKPWKQLALPIVAFDCANGLGTCMVIKKWLLMEMEARAPGSKEFVRMDCLELHDLPQNTPGKLLMLEDIATIDTAAGSVPVGILGYFVPGDQRVRWFYSLCSLSGVLLELEKHGFLGGIGKVWEPGTKKHQSLYTFVKEAFHQATTFPEHPDFVNAMSITDYAAAIHDPEKALSRLLCQDVLNQSKEGLDLEDDRYLLFLHDSERYLASLVELHCAEYLLVKRSFFKDLYIAVYRSDKKVEDGQRVRTNHAHQRYLEEVYEWTSTRAKKLVMGWKTLGLLDEKSFLKWTKKGGMLAYANYDEDEDKNEGNEDEEAEVDSGVEAE